MFSESQARGDGGLQSQQCVMMPVVPVATAQDIKMIMDQLDEQKKMIQSLSAVVQEMSNQMQDQRRHVTWATRNNGSLLKTPSTSTGISDESCMSVSPLTGVSGESSVPVTPSPNTRGDKDRNIRSPPKVEIPDLQHVTSSTSTECSAEGMDDQQITPAGYLDVLLQMSNDEHGDVTPASFSDAMQEAEELQAVNSQQVKTKLSWAVFDGVQDGKDESIDAVFSTPLHQADDQNQTAGNVKQLKDGNEQLQAATLTKSQKRKAKQKMKAMSTGDVPSRSYGVGTLHSDAECGSENLAMDALIDYAALDSSPNDTFRQVFESLDALKRIPECAQLCEQLGDALIIQQKQIQGQRDH